MVPLLSPKSDYFLLIWVKFCLKNWLLLIFLSKKLAFSKPILRAGFLDEMLVLSKKKSTFVLVSWLLYFHSFAQM